MAVRTGSQAESSILSGMSRTSGSRFALALAAALCIATTGFAQQPAARSDSVVFAPPQPGNVQRLTLRDGSQLVGKIISADSAAVRFESALGVSVIPVSSIQSVSEEAPGVVRDGRYYFPNPNATRLLFSTNGRMLKAKTGYFSD